MSVRYNDIIYNNNPESPNYLKFGRIRSVYFQIVYVEYYDKGKKEFYPEFESNSDVVLVDLKSLPNTKIKLDYMPECNSIPLNYPIHENSEVFVDSVKNHTVYVHNGEMGKCLYGVDLQFCSHLKEETKK